MYVITGRNHRTVSLFLWDRKSISVFTHTAVLPHFEWVNFGRHSVIYNLFLNFLKLFFDTIHVKTARSHIAASINSAFTVSSFLIYRFNESRLY